MKISARNQLAGTVSSVKEGIVTAEVVIKNWQWGGACFCNYLGFGA